MNSSHYSKAAIVALAAIAVLSIPVAAVTVTPSGVPSEVQTNATVGVDSELSFELTNLYTQYDNYELVAQTELESAVWTVTTQNPQEQTIDQFTTNGSNITVDIGGSIASVVVELEGQAPPSSAVDFNYQPPQSFTLVAFSQRQSGGVASPIGEPITVRPYTTASDDARSALDAAAAAIEDAESGGADVSDAEDTFGSAVEAFNSGQFDLASNLAEDAESEADAAAASQSQQSLLLMIGAGVVVVIVIGGVVYWYLQNRGPADKLG